MAGRGMSVPTAKKKGPPVSSSRSSESQDFRSSGNNPSSGMKAKKTDVNSTPHSGTGPLSMAEFPPMKDKEGSSAQMHDRTLWLLMHLIGKQVEVQVKSGEIYEGVFFTATTDKGLGILLKMAKKKDRDPADKARPIENFLIYPTDFVQLYAKEVPLDVRNEKEFSTDTEISNLGGARERVLQKWVPEGDFGGGLGDDYSLGDPSDSWDQFAANKEKFGVETSWDEKYYTTDLNKDAPDFKQRVRDASRLAAEIERSGRASNNFHVIEERGFEVDVDEEDRYGAVIRQAVTSQPGKYVPPQKRKDDVADVKPSPLEARKSEKSLERNSSSEDVGELGSPKGPGSPHGGDSAAAVVSERLRLRLYLASERLKNSAPVPPQQNDPSFPVPKSPLLSPLIADPQSINALSLEPLVPKLAENVLEEFLNFSLSSKKEKNPQQNTSFREKSLADMKNFSKSLEKKVVGKDSISPRSPSTTPRGEEPVKESEKAPEPKKEAAPAPVEAKKETTTAAASAEDKKSALSKLNPNAKTFKPMSANAPSFTPGGSSSAATAPAVPILVPAQEFMYPQAADPYFAYGGVPRQPMYPGIPFPQPMMPNQQVVYPSGPGGIRIVGPPVYPPNAQYPYGQPIVYGAPPPANASGNAVQKVPSGSAQGTSPPQFQGAYIPQRVMMANGVPVSANAPQGAFYPGQYGQPQMIVAHPQVYYPPTEQQQGKDGSEANK